MNANERLDWVLLYLSDELKYGEHVDVTEIRDSWKKEYLRMNWATELERIFEHLEGDK